VLKTGELRDDDFTDEIPLVGAESTALWNAAVVDAEGGGEETVDSDLGGSAIEENTVPVYDACVAEAHGTHGVDEQRPADRVIRLGKVRVE
jgi:hypothetical protein